MVLQLLLLLLQFMLHGDLLLMQILVDLGGDRLASQSVEMLGDLVEVLPFLHCVALGG